MTHSRCCRYCVSSYFFFSQPEVLTPKQTVSAIYSFFLALALHPEVLKKAQSEIDAVVGSERLPTFADRPHLPYVNALVLEVFRWHTVVPTGKSHHCP